VNDRQLRDFIICAMWEKELAMSITVEAVYENGVLKPAQPIPLKEREQVRVTIHTPDRLADQTYGMIGWSGDAGTFDRLLQESEADCWEHE
jgi:predicted DNA-binding antitoxin AbrB/MazE fold protein